MTDLDVALRLRLVNMLSSGVAQAVSDLNRVKTASEQVNRATAGAPAQKIPAHIFFENQKLALSAQEAAEKAKAAINGYFDAIDRRLAQIGQMQWAFSELHRLGHDIAKPIEQATDAAVEFEKRIQSIAKAGGMLGAQKQIGEDILAAAKAGNVSWEEIAGGERQLVALGGGDYLDKIGPIRARLAQLIKASESDAGDLYNLLYHYMHLTHMSPNEALQSMQVNYLQGKMGALELKDLAELMPRMIPLGQEYMSDKQVSTELVALLEVLRKQTGSASEAETRARHMMTKLSDPAEAKRIKDEVGVDVFAVREAAKARGENQLFAVLDAIAEKFKKFGDDPEKLGAIARDYYFRSGLEGYMKMREEIKNYLPTADDAQKTTMADFASTVDTAAAALERLKIAADEARIRAGDAQKPVVSGAADVGAAGADSVSWFAKNFPALTAVLGTGTEVIGKGLSAIGTTGQWMAGLATAGLALKWLAGKAVLPAIGDAAPAVKAAPAPASNAATAAAAAAAEVPAWISTIAPTLRSFWITLLISSISDAFDQHQIAKPGFMEKVRADEAEEDKRRREGNPLNAVMRPDAANAVQDFWTHFSAIIGGASSTDAAGAAIGKAIGDAAKQGASQADMGSAGKDLWTRFSTMIGGASNIDPASAAIGKAIGDAARQGASQADMGPAGQQTMEKYAAGLAAAEGKAVAAVEQIVAKLKAMLEFTATPTIQPRLAPGSPAPSSSAAPEKHSRVIDNRVQIGQAHFHGVKDVAALHRQMTARLDRSVAAGRAGALHDMDVGGMG